jgi:hypothetical protein
MNAKRLIIIGLVTVFACSARADVVRALESSDGTRAVYAAVINGTKCLIKVEADFSKSNLKSVEYDLARDRIQVRAGSRWSGTLALTFNFEPGLESGTGTLKFQAMSGAAIPNVNRHNRVNGACRVTLTGFDQAFFDATLAGGTLQHAGTDGEKPPPLKYEDGKWVLVTESAMGAYDRIEPSVLTLTDKGNGRPGITSFTYTYTPAKGIEPDDPAVFRFRIEAGGPSVSPVRNADETQ